MIKHEKMEKNVLVQLKQDIDKEVSVQQEIDAAVATKMNLANKIRAAELRKAALKQKADEKGELQRLRRIRARLKSRGSNRAVDGEGLRDRVEDQMLLRGADETRIVDLNKRLLFKAMDRVTDDNAAGCSKV